MSSPESVESPGFAAPAAASSSWPSPQVPTHAPPQLSPRLLPKLLPKLLIDPPDPLLLPTPPHYHLGHALRHGGLLGLPPLLYGQDETMPTLQVVLYPRAAGYDVAGTPPAIEVLVVQPAPGGNQPLLVYGLRPSPLADALLEQLRQMLRLDDDLEVFYRLTDQDPDLGWVAACDGGRLLRAATVFEDLVHCLALAYGSRAPAVALLQRLCTHLGPRTSLGRPGFPSPAQIAEAPAWIYEQVINPPGPKLGGSSRAARGFGKALRELAAYCESGSLHPDSLRRRPSALSGFLQQDDESFQDALQEELEWQERVCSVLTTLPGYRRRGVGARAVCEMLLRLSCYDGLRLDIPARTAWTQRFPPSRKKPKRAAAPTSAEKIADGLTIARRMARRLSAFSLYRALAQELLLVSPPAQ